MKKKIFFYSLMLIFLANVSFGQVYQAETVYGRNAKRLTVDSTLRIPKGLSTRTNAYIGDSAGLIALKDTTDGVYYFTGQRWKQLGGGGGSGTLTGSDTVNISYRIDTIGVLLTGYVPTSRSIATGWGLSGGGNLTANRTFIADSATLSTYYLRIGDSTIYYPYRTNPLGYLTSASLSGYQPSITLTTTGSSGAATFISNTLNIPNYTLAGLGGVSSTLADGKIWVGNASNVATAVTPSGDWTISNTGVNTLASVNSNVGTFNTLTVNAKGLVTAASNTSYLTANQPITVTATGDATGTSSSSATAPSLPLTLATVNSNVGTFGSATQVAQVTVNAKGLTTAASNVTITPAATSITGAGDLTKTDDTNVTLTLGGTPTGSLLKPTSITAGWTGTLAGTRGGTGTGTTAIGDILIGTASNSWTKLSHGTTAQRLAWDGSNIVWRDTATASGGGGSNDSVAVRFYNKNYYAKTGIPNIFSISAADSNMVIIGDSAGRAISGTTNVNRMGLVAIGGKALEYYNGVAVADNGAPIAVGYAAARFATTPQTIAMGYLALGQATTGTENFGFGYKAGYGISTGIRNTIIGNNAYIAANGQENTVIGGDGLKTATNSAEYNVAIGNRSMYLSTSPGNQNTAVGWNTMGGSSFTGGENTVVGFQAGLGMTGGVANTLIGRKAGAAITSGLENIAINCGRSAASDEVTNIRAGSYNVSIGPRSGGNVGSIDGNSQLAIAGAIYGNGSGGFAFNGSFSNAYTAFTPTIPASVMLDLPSTTKGFRLPSMTTTQRDAIASPATGLQIYNTTLNCINIYNGTNWTGDVVVSSAGTLTLKYGVDYSFTGTTTTWTLPAISATLIGRTNGIKIKNRGSGAITLNTATGSTLYTTTTASSITINAGAACELFPDGTYNLVQYNL